MKLNPSIIEHWHSQYDGLRLSTKEFYLTVQDELKAKNFPNVRCKTIILDEGGLFSRKREYLVISRKRLHFVVCAAPFGNNYFFSWYLKEYNELAELLAQIPLIGRLLTRLFSQKITFYRYDTVIMFKDAIKATLKNVLAEIEKDKGVRAADMPLTKMEPV